MSMFIPCFCLISTFVEFVNPVICGMSLVFGRDLPRLFWGNTDKEETADLYKLWIAYWIILVVAGWALDLIGEYVPFVAEAKLLFVIWLQHPQFRGAAVLYDGLVEKNWKFVAPVYEKLEGLQVQVPMAEATKDAKFDATKDE